MNLLERIAGWIWEASWQASVIAVLVLAVQWALGARLTAGWRYGLWFLVAARLLLPALPESRTSLYNFTPRIGVASVPSSPETPPPAVREPGWPVESDLPWMANGTLPAASTKTRGWPRVVTVLTGAWLAGVLVLGTRLALACRRFRSRAVRMAGQTHPELLSILAGAAAEMRVSRPRLLETEAVETPALAGVFRPVIFLPAHILDRFTAEEIRHVMLHELAHLKRQDVAANWLITVLQILHWFNPVLWLAFRRMRADREMACDALVLGTQVKSERQAYGLTLLRVIEHARRPAASTGLVGILEDRDQIRRRMQKIATYVKAPWFASLAGLFVLLVITLATLTGAISKFFLEGTAPQDALVEAAAQGDLSLVKEALAAGADVNRPGFISQTGEFHPLAAAAMNGRLEVVEFLVARGAKLKQPGKLTVKRLNAGRTAIAMALIYGHEEVAAYLKKQGAICPEIVYAAGIGDVAGFRKLLGNAGKEEIRSALEAAAGANHVEILQAAPVQKYADNLCAGNNDLNSFICLAAETGALSSVEFLADHGADLKNNPLMPEAAGNNHADLVRWLAKKGVPIDQALGSAAQFGAMEAAKALFELGADPNESDETFGLTPLFFANGPEMAELLLEHGADLQHKDKRGENAAWRDVYWNRSPELLEFFIQKGIDLKGTVPSYGDGTILHRAVGFWPVTDFTPEQQAALNHRMEKIIRLLVRHGVDLEARSKGGETPLMKAVGYGQLAAVRTLLDLGANVNSVDERGWMPLSRALVPFGSDQPEIVQVLLAKGADVTLGVDAPRKPGDAPSPLKAAMTGGRYRLPIDARGSVDSPDAKVTDRKAIVFFLMKSGARFAAPKGSAADQMLAAATLGDGAKVRELLNRGISADIADEAGWTPLMSAAALGHGDVLKMLLGAGSDVNAQDASGRTALSLALACNPAAADCELLLANQADPNLASVETDAPLTLAIIRGDYGLFQKLMQAGARAGTDGALNAAIRGDRSRMALDLLRAGADPNAKTEKSGPSSPIPQINPTALFWAVSRNQLEVVRALLDAGANVQDVNWQFVPYKRGGDSEEMWKLVRAAREKAGKQNDRS